MSINTSNIDIEFIKKALGMARNSFNEGAFPAVAVLVKNNKIISQNTSAKWLQIVFHAESKTIDEAISKLGSQLSDCTLYCSMQPCLMCMSRAYWAGIRKIFYAVSKDSVSYKTCYESDLNHEKLLERFNEKIKLIQVSALEKEALKLVREWEKNKV